MRTKDLFRAVAVIIATVFLVHFADATSKPVRIDQRALSTFSVEEQAEIQCIAERLDEIASMDRSGLTRQDRSSLKMEVRELKAKADAFNRAGNGTVIYISGGTLLVILLLILILS